MKRNILTVLTLVLIVTAIAEAEEPKPVKQKDYRFSVQSTTLSLTFLSMGIGIGIWMDRVDGMWFGWDSEIQYAISDYWAVAFSPTFSFNIASDREVFQFNLIPQMLFHPFGRWLNGMYVGAYPDIGLIWDIHKYKYREDEQDFYTKIGFGTVAGYQHIFKNGLTLNAGVVINIGISSGSIWSIGLIQKKYDPQFLIISNPYFIKLGYSF